jgi:hypothetical protein
MKIVDQIHQCSVEVKDTLSEEKANAHQCLKDMETLIVRIKLTLVRDNCCNCEFQRLLL